MRSGHCRSTGRCSSPSKLPKKTTSYKLSAERLAASSRLEALGCSARSSWLVVFSLQFPERCIDERLQLSSSHVFRPRLQQPDYLSILWRDRHWPLLLQLWRPTVGCGLRQLLRPARPRSEVLPSLRNAGRRDGCPRGAIQTECASVDSCRSRIPGAFRDGGGSRVQRPAKQYGRWIPERASAGRSRRPRSPGGRPGSWIGRSRPRHFQPFAAGAG